MHYVNRRENPRIEVALNCRVASPGPWFQSSFLTENLSRNGLLVRWSSGASGTPPPGPGDRMVLEIELPSHAGFGRKCIRCHVSVVRLSTPADGVPRVAFSVDYMKFDDYFNGISLIPNFENTGASRPWSS